MLRTKVTWSQQAFGLMLTIAVATTAMADTLSEVIAADYDATLEDLFIHFHQNPELSFLESATANRMASELRALGYDVTEEVGGTGVVAVLANSDGPTTCTSRRWSAPRDSSRRAAINGPAR